MGQDVPRGAVTPVAGRGVETTPQPPLGGTVASPPTTPSALDGGEADASEADAGERDAGQPMPTAGAPAPQPGPWMKLGCVPGTQYPDLLSQLDLAREVDYAVLYMRWAPFVFVVDTGSACETASDHEACQVELVKRRDSVTLCSGTRAFRSCSPRPATV